MRRPWMRRLQDASLRIVPERRREGARASLLSQNRFARRYGLVILSLALNLLLASVVLTLVFQLTLELHQSGYLNPGDQFRERVMAKSSELAPT